VAKPTLSDLESLLAKGFPYVQIVWQPRQKFFADQSLDFLRNFNYAYGVHVLSCI